MTARKSGVAAGVPDGPTTITLRLRSAPSAVTERRQRRIRDRLGSIAEATADELRTERWSDRVRVPVLDDGSEAVAAVSLYDELRAAVDEAGGRLHPFFREQNSVEGTIPPAEPSSDDGAVEGGERDIVFPVVCLTIRRSGRLTGVYPCWLDGEHHSVEDGLARLEAGVGDDPGPATAAAEDAENLW